MAAKKVPPPKPRAVVVRWLTRERDVRTGREIIREWSARPNRHTDTDGPYWNAPVLGSHVADYAPGTAYATVRTIPDDDRQCVRLYALE